MHGASHTAPTEEGRQRYSQDFQDIAESIAADHEQLSRQERARDTIAVLYRAYV